ncbi:hypothetical protein P280DRAFT_39797 [Massarina eburnea CBS 473.64]|uniref:RING-type E3 ubiquitin transferase n=1 Tax=Massarina eburnea CBS 473.64 TaxID=1395130 RepID=A0A6A6RZD4_9PLEO|nr:hypothetical protein P280DRAFT_39797 [Massarina eburnea CBS 473.64]
MDQSRSSAQPAGPRETMFCHECHDEWYRDEKGIICPECQSEFTEIIEDDNDPRDNFEHGHEDDDDSDSLPSLEEALHNHPPLDHNPWRDNDDPEEADISAMRFQPIGPGRFHVQATIHRTISPTQFIPGGTGGMGAFQSFLTNLVAGAVPAQDRGRERDQSQETDGQSESRAASGGSPHVHRFTYSALHPRDDNHPGPRLEPVDDLNNVMTSLFAMMGEPPGGGRGGAGHEMPPNPLMGLLAAMSGGQHGDAVYSQEALDRIVSQLMEQTATSNAPGPAPPQDIEALPRKQVTDEMLGAEHRAECSICMDEVTVGGEVTELPCKHWFHHGCVAAWLSEHDTCPHCRKSIKKDGEAVSGNANASSSRADPTSSMPGAFDVAGDGTLIDPWVVSSSPPSGNAGSNAQGESSDNGSRLRRGWFDS